MFKSGLIVLGSVGLLFLGACSNSNPTANNENAPASKGVATPSASTQPSPSASAVTKTEGEHGKSHGGQVVETGAYHLEFVPEKEANKTHMDLYLLKGDNHQAVPNAKVIAQVQLPDGKQKTVPLNYDADDKHYTGILPDKATGQYQVKITGDIKGEKVNGRFNFNR
ncbi:hypothetical protein G7B40_023530 [Aetokthonos hydrillicola Thurmond2011]|jgi:hypothetical protein|uniref:YtkA-like domain-containing protein n=1 Tax=Aetokthonos hydrillicola Thurmond2011 TaxID=2712845 RepID=A0AAP5M6X6_9CYAN|nr:hypothetical protein [Aetokthonos hydrillicola]MBO3463718.1 hypothetical protein [Aetokthonos hydrillicola CCALA 1050]MDR9897516.1 hypothetical protein [Aetokthonos hydrillicola Thurmond2011]